MTAKRWLLLIIVGTLGILGALWIHHRRHSHDEVRIGAIFDMTGSLSYMGQWSLEGAKLAESQINAAGGINGKPIRIIMDDAETKPQLAATIFQRMVSVDHLPVVIGFNGSSEVMAAAPLADRSHVVVFSTGAASPTVTGAGKFVFRNRLSGAFEAARMAEVAHDSMHLNTGAILYINTDYGLGYADSFEQRFRQLGGVIRVRAAFTQDQRDFRAQLAQVQADPSITFVYLASHVREGASILRQASDLQLHEHWLASNAIEAPELFQIAGPAADGLLFTVEGYDPQSTEAAAFNAAYRRAYAKESEMFAAHAYDAVRLLATIIGRVGPDGERIRAELYNVRDWPGASGRTTFDKNGDVVKSVAVKRVSGGRVTTLTDDEINQLATH